MREEGAASSTVLPPPGPLSACACSSLLAAGQDWVADGRLDDPGFRADPPHQARPTPTPSSRGCETEAFPWEPSLGLGQALVCN